ncbi:helix-turn-helix domain-containing protein [Spirosoma radiotolerans]|uniref:XRE family transcriptional regulator n=1 Tax=Spirosoma radiotolerans TaxID=1379870 RepID=A0A0E3ZTG7_9BACT|nr:helix-turn-helix transcriptional regulator [Spirosoma radiotolerans]AKD54025.1 XRE family transcriptional regulator [Spirosoma radiotolerans]
MADIKQKVGQQVRDARKVKGLTLKEIGEKVGVAESTFSLYESGKQNLTIETLQKIADALSIDIATFFK